MAKKSIKKKTLKLDKGKYYIIRIEASFNNTRISLIDNGNVLRGITTGHLGFKGTQKSTPYASEKLTNSFMDEVHPAGGRKFNVEVKGVGLGRTSSIRVLQEYINKNKDKENAITFDYIRDITPQSHSTSK